MSSVLLFDVLLYNMHSFTVASSFYNAPKKYSRPDYLYCATVYHLMNAAIVKVLINGSKTIYFHPGFFSVFSGFVAKIMLLTDEAINKARQMIVSSPKVVAEFLQIFSGVSIY